jgi:hypothetical protein
MSLADSPRDPCSSHVRRVRAHLRFRSGFVLGFRCSWFADGPSFSSGWSGSRADGPPGHRGWSVFLSSFLVVLLALTDCPRHLAGQSASAWQLCSLVRFLPPFSRASACASRNHSYDLRLNHNLVVLAIGV